VQRATKLRILEFVAPIFLGVGFLFKIVYNVAFAWWLDLGFDERRIVHYLMKSQQTCIS
jgi:hypothetical protein